MELSPKVDDIWLKYHPEHAAYKGETLHHHHINQGKMATAVPAKAHYDYFSELHPKLRGKIQGQIKGISVKGIASSLPTIVGELGDLAALLNKNPDGFYWALFPPTPSVGKVQFDPDSMLYFTPTMIEKTYWEETGEIKSVRMSMDYYSGFLWDEDSSKYVGADYQKTEHVLFKYDKEGKVKSTGRIM